MVTERSLIKKPIPPRIAMPKKQILTLSQKVFRSGFDRVLRRRDAERKKPMNPIETLLSGEKNLKSFALILGQNLVCEPFGIEGLEVVVSLSRADVGDRFSC